MAHEKSISVGQPPKVYLVPTIIDGKDVGADEAMRLFETGKLKPLEGPFKTIEEADKASKRRSAATPKTLREDLETAFEKSAKREEVKKVPLGTRPGGVVNPELHPVRPKVPGTRDIIRRPGTTTDPEILSRQRPEI